MMQANQLLVVRRRLTLPTGLTTIDTGIRQANVGVTPPDAPLSGEDPTGSSAGVGSRVQVMQQAPLAPWVDNEIRHSEPRLNVAGTIEVDFFNPGAEVEVNVCFWDPHTMAGPVQVDTYNEFTCTTPEFNGFATGFGEDALVFEVANPATASGEVVVAFISFSMDAQFELPGSDPEPVEAGWTLIRRGGLDLGGGVGVKFAAFFRISDLADPATYNFIANVAGVGNASGNGYLLSYGSGYQPADAPFVDVAVVVQATPGSPLLLDAPSVTISDAPAVLLSYFIAAQNISAFWTTPVGMVQVFQQAIGGTAPATVPALNDESIASAGATGVRTSSSTDANPTTGMAYSLAILPICGLFPPIV